MTKEEYKELTSLKHILGRTLAYEILDPIMEQTDAQMLAVPMAYVLLKHLENGADISSPEAFVESLGISDEKEKKRKLSFYKGLMERVWNVVTEAPARSRTLSGDKKMAIKALKTMVLFYDFEKTKKDYSSMPDSIAELAIRILDLKEDDRVCEYCTGRGTFSALASLKEPKAAYTGIEKDGYKCEITSIRVEVSGGRIDMIEGDMFEQKPEKLFTKAFINYDFAKRKTSIKPDRAYEGSLLETVNNTEIKFADWQFIANVIDGLEDGGKAVVVTNNGSLNNRYDKEVREIFINRGYIEAVIALPEKLFDNTMIPVTLLVLTKRNASDEAPKTVKMVEASGFCENARFTNIITDENVDEIIHALNEDTDFGRVPIDKIKEKDFVLAVDKYLDKKVSLSNSREFGDFIVNIKRGTPMKAEELKAIETKDSGCEYLAIGNIVDGYIDHDSVKHIKPDAKLANYQINDGDLIISKGGKPFKIAVADVPEGSQVIASGNLYVIEIDKNKGVPYFFKAFLESDKGQKLLDGAAVGSVISMISAEAIRKLSVPDYPIYEQQKIANEMKEVTMTLRERARHYKKIMERLRNKATHICEEWNTNDVEEN